MAQPLIVGDHNWQKATRPGWLRRRGRGLRPWHTHPEAVEWRRRDRQQGGESDWLPEDLRTPAALPMIPYEEWPDRIADLERRQASSYHVWKRSPIGVLNQKSFGWCHAYSPAAACMIGREAAGLPYVALEPASVAGPVTGYKNAGAWIMDDLRQITRAGIASTDYVPEFCTSRRKWKTGAEEDALRRRVLEWEAHRGRHHQKQGSWLLHGYAVCVGLHWWSHAVTYLRVVDADRSRPATDWRRYRMGALNSWGPGYGDGGYFELEGDRSTADEIYVQRAQQTATARAAARMAAALGMAA